MSYVEIVKIKKDNTFESVGRVQNASSHHQVVWNYFAQKYLGLEFFNTHSSLIEQQKLWDLFEDERLTKNERIILGATYDFVLVKKEDISLVIDAFKSFENESNLSEQADILAYVLNDDDCIAIGWQPSFTDMWQNYDILTEKRHWSLLDQINIIQETINNKKEAEYDEHDI